MGISTVENKRQREDLEERIECIRDTFVPGAQIFSMAFENEGAEVEPLPIRSPSGSGGRRFRSVEMVGARCL